MRFLYIIYKTALYLAVEKENLEIIKLLLNNDKIDISIINILIINYTLFKKYIYFDEI